MVRGGYMTRLLGHLRFKGGELFWLVKIVTKPLRHSEEDVGLNLAGSD